MNSNGINLLIVDDEEDFLSAIGRSLTLRGFNVISVNSGAKALAAARERPVDIALVDLKMPGMDGQTTLEALKKEHASMEIVILTGHGTIDSAAACSREGAYAYLQKPCEFETLLETLGQAFKRVVMHQKQIEEEKMDALLQISVGNSPREIINKLRAFRTCQH
ncbi:MAG: response regulator [Desulfosarcinaceae bacterium]